MAGGDEEKSRGEHLHVLIRARSKKGGSRSEIAKHLFLLEAWELKTGLEGMRAAPRLEGTCAACAVFRRAGSELRASSLPAGSPRAAMSGESQRYEPSVLLGKGSGCSRLNGWLPSRPSGLSPALVTSFFSLC